MKTPLAPLPSASLHALNDLCARFVDREYVVTDDCRALRFNGADYFTRTRVDLGTFPTRALALAACVANCQTELAARYAGQVSLYGTAERDRWPEARSMARHCVDLGALMGVSADVVRADLAASIEADAKRAPMVWSR